ncbi:uncharacterized protein ColSpa_07345 [Colletotrichum spaethianum]|uniref:Nucleoside phosphorylase domain-containing protein n=1 Tax=Colletotrichum spaethianum TaxID=700344 RepID=A0AA37P840_9PEZI|nr:uncharacterized protein ColSpa_07345 [Colletotrichum spaethianum]GKT47164.1 hypothetical protein ColSpa_07345 [Colletotrichum spaethianum]
MTMLDNIHKPLPMSPNDSNVYTYGDIGPHNVVIACLPSGQYGTISAAVVANNMHWSFPFIQIRLMVGIGGGVPGDGREVDIRLGDIVVSNPVATSPGVVKYDFGKTMHNGKFERTGSLSKPPPSLLAAVSRLRTEHEIQPSRIPSILADMEHRYPSITQYFYSYVDYDRLFKAHI